jgi:hypothetical protein
MSRIQYIWSWLMPSAQGNRSCDRCGAGAAAAQMLTRSARESTADEGAERRVPAGPLLREPSASYCRPRTRFRSCDSECCCRGEGAHRREALPNFLLVLCGGVVLVKRSARIDLLPPRCLSITHWSGIAPAAGLARIYGL